MQPQSGIFSISLDDSFLYAGGATTSGSLVSHMFSTDSDDSFNLFYRGADKIITITASAGTTIGI